MSARPFRLPPASIAALVLFILGIAIDQGFTRPALAEIQRLNAKLAGLREQATAVDAREHVARQIAATLGGDDLGKALAGGENDDALTFLSRAVQRAGLTRVALNTRTTDNVGHLRRTSLSLQLTGRYEGLVNLVRAIERSPRVFTIDAVTVTREAPNEGLTFHIDLSAYDARKGPAS